MHRHIALAAFAFLTACAAHQQYWVRPETGIKQTAADLSECRIAANNGGQKVFSARELETPCMVAKGYDLSNSPPSN